MTKSGGEGKAAGAVPIATIGYQSATVASFLEALTAAGVALLVDVRAVASSRRPGFSKTRLAENLASVGIDYRHLRGLGTPSDGRAAARAGRHEEMKVIFREHLLTPEARADLDALTGMVESGTHICLLCFEADPAECHRSIVIEKLEERLRLDVSHLRPEIEEG